MEPWAAKVRVLDLLDAKDDLNHPWKDRTKHLKRPRQALICSVRREEQPERSIIAPIFPFWLPDRLSHFLELDRKN
jgi:hypothetical protein